MLPRALPECGQMPRRLWLSRQTGAGSSCSVSSRRLYHMDAILLVFAIHFKDVGVGHEIMRDLDGKRLRVHLRIVKSHFPIQVSEIAASETFREAQRVAMRMAQPIESGSVVEAGGLDHKRIALPAPNRVAQESRKIELLGKLAAVGEDLAMHVADFIQDHSLPRRLNDFHRLGE